MRSKGKIGILKQIQSDAQLLEKWDMLPDEKQDYFRQVDERKLVPNILSDIIFKTVFDPDINPKRISRLVSSILGKEISVIRSLDKEGIHLSENSKGVILDVVVQFDDGSVADVEIQREGVKIPPQRAATYSANLLTRQYAIEKGEDKRDVDFRTLRPVYTIVIMEKSPEPFSHSPECVHHFRQRSDTGVEIDQGFELLQYYDFISLDIFRERRPHVASMLQTWLDFLSIRDVDVMEHFLEDKPEFKVIYDQAVTMMAGREELLSMLQELFAEEDIGKTIVLAMESEAREELEKAKQQIQTQSDQIKTQSDQINTLNDQLQTLSDQIQQLMEQNKIKDSYIRKLEKQVNH